MNWGNKLLLTFLVFAGGMIYLVYRSMHTNFDLVEKDYYKTELVHQQQIDAENRTMKLTDQVRLQLSGKAVAITFPAEFKGRHLAGEIWFYCASDARRDRHMILTPDSMGIQTIHRDNFDPGLYQVRINWSADTVQYFQQLSLNIN